MRGRRRGVHEEVEDCGGKRTGGQWDEGGGGGASTRRWRTAEGRERAVSGMRGSRGVHEAMEDCGGKIGVSARSKKTREESRAEPNGQQLPLRIFSFNSK